MYGIKYGLRGFYDRSSKPVHLTPELVDSIQLRGGTILVRVHITALLFRMHVAAVSPAIQCEIDIECLNYVTRWGDRDPRSRGSFSAKAGRGWLARRGSYLKYSMITMSPIGLCKFGPFNEGTVKYIRNIV